MLNLTFHWAWIPFVIVIIIGIIAFWKLSGDSGDGPAAGLGSVAGCGVFLFALAVALVIGGIWLW